jgi:hypothetical protein
MQAIFLIEFLKINFKETFRINRISKLKDTLKVKYFSYSLWIYIILLELNSSL